RTRRRNHLRRNGGSRLARAGHDALAWQRQLVDAEVDADRASHPALEACSQDRGPTDTRRLIGRQRGSPMHNTPPYPLQLTGELSPRLRRGLWLVKWLLAIPHCVVLLFLWIGFAVVSVVAFFAILFTGRYPRGLFDFNVGVLRWTWRVGFYSYSALGTDQYPRFTLKDAPDYPARLEVEYPESLSRGLVLSKWWLLALPQYLIVAVFAGCLGRSLRPLELVLRRRADRPARLHRGRGAALH